eukprot:COSAG06_NODE_22039_length_736_cov_1.538462_1_plen_81_part_01
MPSRRRPRTAATPAALPPPLPPPRCSSQRPAEKSGSLINNQLFLRLSRACLGKHSGFACIDRMAQKKTCFRTEIVQETSAG